jgi:hypothetical protein
VEMRSMVPRRNPGQKRLKHIGAWTGHFGSMGFVEEHTFRCDQKNHSILNQIAKFLSSFNIFSSNFICIIFCLLKYKAIELSTSRNE